MLLMAWVIIRKMFPFSAKTIELNIEGNIQHNKATTESKIQASLRELNGNSYQVLMLVDMMISRRSMIHLDI